MKPEEALQFIATLLTSDGYFTATWPIHLKVQKSLEVLYNEIHKSQEAKTTKKGK